MKTTLKQFISKLPKTYYSKNHDNITDHAISFLESYYESDTPLSSLLEDNNISQDTIEKIYEYANSDCPVYASELLEWQVKNWQTVDEVVEEMGLNTSSTLKRINSGYVISLENQLLEFLQDHIKLEEAYS